VAQRISEVMTAQPVGLQASATVAEAARAMKQYDIGDVLVMDGDRVCGLVTDRDIVVRAIAEGRDPQTTKADEICSHEIVSIGPDDSVDDAVRVMRERAIRRLPVMQGGSPVGMVSIGDLAVERDPGSALADISAAPPNA
jgi:CBS domain-containing protein